MKDWLNVFRHRDDFVVHSPDEIHNAITSDGTLNIDSTAVLSNAIVWNGVAFTPSGNALYVVYT